MTFGFFSLVVDNKCARICRIVLSHARAPRCYDSIEDFQAKWHQCVYNYSKCIENFLKERMRDSHIWGTLRLVWLDPDLILNGAFDIESIKEELVGYLLDGTNGMGVEWCNRVNREVIEDVCLTCQTYIAAIKHHNNLLDSNFMSNLACLEARTKLGLSYFHKNPHELIGLKSSCFHGPRAACENFATT